MYVRVHSARRAHRVRAPCGGLILYALAAPGGDPGAARIVRAEATAEKSISARQSNSAATWRLLPLLLILRAGARRSCRGPRESRPAGGGWSEGSRTRCARVFRTHRD